MDWPLSPNVNDTITGPRGEVWKWDGDKWVSVIGTITGNIHFGSAPPDNPRRGDLWFDSTNNKLMIHDGSQWNVAGGGGGVIIASVAPDTANAGQLWWDNTDGRLYVWFEDAWVGVTDGSADGGGGGSQMGVTDGSKAAPGEVGEILDGGVPFTSAVVVAENAPANTMTLASSIIFPPGDWQFGGVWLGKNTTGLANVTIRLYLTDNSSVTADNDLFAVGTAGVTNPLAANLPFLALNNSVTTTRYIIVVNPSAIGAGQNISLWGSWFARRMR